MSNELYGVGPLMSVGELGQGLLNIKRAKQSEQVMTRDEATALFERVYQQLHTLPYNIDIKLMFRHSGGIWKDQLDTWCVEVDDERLKSEEDWKAFKRMYAILETDQDLEEYADAARAEAERELEREE